jgi:hypothetical protein
MTLQAFCATVVPCIASLAYLSAGIANLYARQYAPAVMWICYAVANLCLIYSFTFRK